MASPRRIVPWLIVLAIIGFAVYSFAGDFGKIGKQLEGFGWWAFAAALGLALLNYVLRFARWQLYLRRQQVKVPARDSAIVFSAGLSLAITPAKVGELVKSYLLREMHGVPFAQTAPIVIAERVTDLVALLLVAVVGVAAYGLDSTIVVGSTIVIAAGLALLASPRPTRWIIEQVTKPAKMRRLRQPIFDIYDGLATLCEPKLLIGATALGVPAWACECLGFGLIINAFPGTHCDLGLASVIYATATIAGALSFLPGGLGVTEGGMALLLERLAHVDRGAAVDATLLTRFATLWFAVVLGLGFLWLARRMIANIARSKAAAGAGTTDPPVA